MSDNDKLREALKILESPTDMFSEWERIKGIRLDHKHKTTGEMLKELKSLKEAVK